MPKSRFPGTRIIDTVSSGGILPKPMSFATKPVGSSAGAKSVNSWQVPEASGALRPHISYPPAGYPLPVVK